MSLDGSPQSDAYEVLAVHPTAPSELVAAMYWAQAGDLQRRRAAGEHVDDELHHLTRSYECVADSERRASYNATVGLLAQPLIIRPLPPTRRSLRSRLLRRPRQGSIDLYEVMGVARNVPAELLPHAHQIMRDQYLRLRAGKRKTQLLEALERSYKTLRSPEARERHDALAAKSPNDVQLDSALAGDLPHPKAKTVANVVPVTPPASPAKQDEASPPRRRLSAKPIRPLLRAARFTLLVVAAGLRLTYHAMRGGASKAGPAWQSLRSRSATQARPSAGSEAPPPIIARARAPDGGAKLAPLDIEEQFLGRVATSVKESESHLGEADPRPGRGTL